MRERKYVRIFLLIPAVIVLYFVFQIFRPFIKAVALAVILASICYPAFEWISRKLKGRKNLSALMTCLLVVAVIVVPITLLTFSLAKEVGQVYLEFQMRLERGDFNNLVAVQENSYLVAVIDWLGQFVDLGNIDLVGGLAALLQAASVFFLRHSTSIVGGFAQVVADFFIMMITLFFLFRDGAGITRDLSRMTPLTNSYEMLIVQKFKEITRATVAGSLLTALAQGVAGGVVFWVLGLPNVLFWGALMSLFSLVPVVGPSVVWLPWAVYLVASGFLIKGLILIGCGVLVIGTLDNILRPLFIEGQSGMHTLMVFFSIMGGIAYFGMVGIIFGPIIVSLGLTFLELYKQEFRAELIKPTE